GPHGVVDGRRAGRRITGASAAPCRDDPHWCYLRGRPVAGVLRNLLVEWQLDDVVGEHGEKLTEAFVDVGAVELVDDEPSVSLVHHTEEEAWPELQSRRVTAGEVPPDQVARAPRRRRRDHQRLTSRRAGREHTSELRLSAARWAREDDVLAGVERSASRLDDV